MMITRRNHYVPIWYQKRFLPPGQESFFYLDLYPERKPLADGRVVTMKNLYHWGPKKCFWEKDLYTTMFFGIPNDEIERYLFGTIDQQGSAGLRALISQDFQQLYRYFIKFFEYLDAQKLRTPKGLAWIKSHYPDLSHIQLMYEMQAIRQMHCTMWVEAVREIVSAEDSSIKFIISDHPVTIYNLACPPDSPQCRYPEDPPIALKASQTIFPLDLDHCLILTNLEYARESDRVDPLTNRTHARYFGETITKFVTMIRERKLQETEVAAINFVIKARARKYIAAVNKDWLFPETLIHDPWTELGKVLLPPKKGLWEFGGEIYVGGKNGKLIHYQDEFGRSLGEMRHLKKELKWEKVGRNDPCPCGSGKKYKRCCLDKPASERPSSTELNIRERNIILFRAVTDILGLAKGKTWLDVRRELNDETVKKIHEVTHSLWPRETNLMNLLPHPDPSILRALYAGVVDPRVILRNVVGFSLYFDEIIILNPFTNPACVKEEYSPIHSPTQYKQETIKNVLLLLQLAPLIEAGIVHMIPDPCDFDYKLRKETRDMAMERLKNWKPDKKEFKAMEPLFKDDFMRNMWSLPEESLKRQVKKVLPDKSDKEIGLVLEYIKEMRNQDPLALLQPMQPGKEGAQLLITHITPNLELGLFLAQVMGACIYTDNSHRWGELLGTMDYESTSGEAGWDLAARSLSSLHLNFLNQVDPQTTLAIRRSGKFGGFRKLLRQIWMDIQSNPEPERVNALAQEFVHELKEVHAKTQAEWQLVQNELHRKIEDSVQRLLSIATGRIEFKIPLGGFGDRNVYRLLLTHSGRSDHLKYLPMAAFVSFDAN